MSKQDFYIKPITKQVAAPLLKKHHYLTSLSRDFKSGFNYGCYQQAAAGERLVGVILFTNLPSPELAVGMLGLQRNQQGGLLELSRLCMTPDVQAAEHNLTSWFVSRAIRQLRKDTAVKAILSYADAGYHNGTIYAACNFDYYGLSDPKKDFYIQQPDGTHIKHRRGKVKGLVGEWRPRTRKHRFLLVFDKSIRVKWERAKWKNQNNLQGVKTA